MKFLSTIDDEDLEVVAIQIRAFLEVTASINQWLMRKRGFKVPPLYESGVRFRVEPWAQDVQWFANCREILKAGHSDCKGLCAWRAAELRQRHPGESFGFHLSWQPLDADPLHAVMGRERVQYDVFHVQIELPPGSSAPIEDVSRFLHQ